MCGIFSIFLNRPLTERDIELGRAGTQALSHRGPDGQGEWMDRQAGVFLGHRRLAIIDPSPASDQPMVQERLVISLNGEIYNYRNLRQRLTGLGHKFRSQGDTEVLLQAWQQYGAGALEMLDGMYGFCLWDGETGWLAVDRFGEKQIYVAETPDGIYASSELTPLVRLLRLSPDLSAERLTPFMALGYIPAPATMYPTITRLLPANCIAISKGRPERPKTYWSPPPAVPGRGRPRPLSEADLDQLQDLLIGSIERRLESDVPLCLFLSSGVDSALIAAIVSRELKRSVKCITVSFPRGQTLDEAPVAGAIADYLDLDYLCVESSEDPENVNAHFQIEILGQPCENLTTASVFQMTSAAREQGYSVGLTGMGGDELFLGYKKHAFAYRHRHKYGIPSWLHRIVAGILSPIAFQSSKIRAYKNVIAIREHERALVIKNGPIIDSLRQLPGFQTWSRATFDDPRALEYAIPEFDLRNTLANNLLPVYDAGSMRASHELRTPYLNHKLLECVASHDPRTFMAFGQKSVLRRLLKRYLPDELVDRPKQGFRFPADQFIRRHNDQAPEKPDLPIPIMEKIWRNRFDPAWQRLAVRTVLWSEFAVWNASMGGDSG